MTSLWRHLWPNYNTLDFKILTQCVKLLGERVLQVWWWYLHWFRRYCKKTRGGARNSPPPVGRGLRLNFTRCFDGKFTYRVINLRLNFGNRSSCLWDHSWGRYAPPPPTECVARQTPTGRGLTPPSPRQPRLTPKSTMGAARRFYKVTCQVLIK